MLIPAEIWRNFFYCGEGTVRIHGAVEFSECSWSLCRAARCAYLLLWSVRHEELKTSWKGANPFFPSLSCLLHLPTHPGPPCTHSSLLSLSWPCLPPAWSFLRPWPSACDWPGCQLQRISCSCSKPGGCLSALLSLKLDRHQSICDCIDSSCKDVICKRLNRQDSRFFFWFILIKHIFNWSSLWVDLLWILAWTSNHICRVFFSCVLCCCLSFHFFNTNTNLINLFLQAADLGLKFVIVLFEHLL